MEVAAPAPVLTVLDSVAALPTEEEAAATDCQQLRDRLVTVRGARARPEPPAVQETVLALVVQVPTALEEEEEALPAGRLAHTHTGQIRRLAQLPVQVPAEEAAQLEVPGADGVGLVAL